MSKNRLSGNIGFEIFRSSGGMSITGVACPVCGVPVGLQCQPSGAHVARIKAANDDATRRLCR